MLFFKIGIPSNFSATGEVNKEGNIKAIGGLKEKFLSVLWSEKSDNLILPQENYEEVQKISKVYYKRFPNDSRKVSFHPVSHCKDLIKLLLE